MTTVPGQAQPSAFRRYLLIGLGFACGVVALGGGLVAAGFWWAGRPEPAKAWDAKSVTATYTGLEMWTGDDDSRYYHFIFTLQNNTDEDFAISSSHGASTVFRYADGSISQVQPTVLTLNIPENAPVFVPSRQKQRVSIIYTVGKPTALTEDDPFALMQRREQGMTGFVVYAKDQRIQINLPVPQLAGDRRG